MNEQSRYKVLVSPRARDMLFSHARFLAQSSVKAGEELFDLFEEKIDSLEDMPERCALYDNPYLTYGKYRKIALGKHLLILFQVLQDTVYIDLIIDNRAKNANLSNS